MEPLTVAVIIMLGKYTIDKASEIIPAIGTEASKMVRLLYELVTGEIAAKGKKEEMIANEYKSDPETYEKPFAKFLDQEIRTNPVFANQLAEILNSYNSIVTKGGNSQHQILVNGDFRATGAVFGSGSVRAKGDIVGGDKK